MSIYTVNSEELLNTSNLITGCAENIKTQVNTMMTYLNQLENTWSGAASMQFQNLAQNWHATQIQVENNLNEISLQLNNAANTYREAEENATALFHM